MRVDSSPGLRVAKHESCVVYDAKSGKVIHIHDSIIFEGAERPANESVDARAMELARQFARTRPGVNLDRLEILYVNPEELESVVTPRVDVKRRKLIQGDVESPPFIPKSKRKPAAAKRPKPKRAGSRK